MSDDRDQRLAALVARARAALPGVALDGPGFAAYLASHPAGAGVLEAAPEGDERGVTEIALVYALRAGQRVAQALFEERYLAGLDRQIARMRLGAAELDEVKQAVRRKLLVADASGALRVEEYAGR